MLPSPDHGFRIERADRTVIIRFSWPEIRNPLSITVLNGLYSITEGLAHESSIDGVIFTGTSDIFASGADLREVAKISPSEAREFSLRGQRLMTLIAALPQITAAAISGPCFGGALDLALACDHRIADANASFAHPGVSLGLITGWGGTQRLPRLVGRGPALELFLTALPIDAYRACSFGLVDAIADDPLARAAEFVSKSEVR